VVKFPVFSVESRMIFQDFDPICVIRPFVTFVI
jgi:hypothetical protein